MQGKAVQPGPLELDWGRIPALLPSGCLNPAPRASVSPPADWTWSLPLPHGAVGRNE